MLLVISITDAAIDGFQYNYNIKYTLLILLGQGTVTISVNQLLLDLTLNPKDINAKPIL